MHKVPPAQGIGLRKLDPSNPASFSGIKKVIIPSFDGYTVLKLKAPPKATTGQSEPGGEGAGQDED